MMQPQSLSRLHATWWCLLTGPALQMLLHGVLKSERALMLFLCCVFLDRLNNRGFWGSEADKQTTMLTVLSDWFLCKSAWDAEEIEKDQGSMTRPQIQCECE